MKYIYPAIFTPETDSGYLVDFPDIPNCFTDGDTLEEAFENAEDALALTLWGMEEEKCEIVPPTSVDKIVAPPGGYVFLIKADTLPVRKMNDTRAVRKNITLPGWMDTLAKERNINFSQLLQNAICRECGISG